MNERRDPFSAAQLEGLPLKNRFIRAGCYEGLSFEGEVTQELIHHHQNLAKGGIGMTTLAYACISPDGRTFADQIVMNQKALPGLRQFTEAIHAEGCAASIQLTHGGYFSDPHLAQGPALAPSKVYNSFRMRFARSMNQNDIQRVMTDFVQSALLAKEAGFDAVEIHAGHGYLLSQFLSPFTNRRKDQWGGDYKSRRQFPARVIAKVRDALGSDMPILVKMNVDDGIRGGLTLLEAVGAGRLFRKAGASLLIPSCGFTSKTPFYMLRGDVPLQEMARNRPSPGERVAARLFGAMAVKAYPFEPLFLQEPADALRRASGLPVAYIGGVTSAKDAKRLIELGFDFLQIGRATIRNPQLINDWAADEHAVSDCDHCNRCVAVMENRGLICVTSQEERGEASGMHLPNAHLIRSQSQ
ncbi:MAG: NADH:flavin oxidoreductase [Spirochaetales bacterium]|nr:NADH:flavin oxidoreductase [Spirochaetales bacterium]